MRVRVRTAERIAPSEALLIFFLYKSSGSNAFCKNKCFCWFGWLGWFGAFFLFFFFSVFCFCKETWTTPGVFMVNVEGGTEDL